MDDRPIIGAYVYPGWHPCPERDRNFPQGWSEWDLVLGARAHFPGHTQPRLPDFEPYNDSLPETASWQIGLARTYGIDLFVYGFFWSRGKRVFYRALDEGFLGSKAGSRFPFALMWANRMPRGVLPVKRPRDPVIEPARLVYTDPEDFACLIDFLAKNYFSRPNYFKIAGHPLLSIYDSTFFIRQMGLARCRQAVDQANLHLKKLGFPGLHLMAVNPAPSFLKDYHLAGFDSLTHYVNLPQWKGEYLQDYQDLSRLRSAEWYKMPTATPLPYFPSVSPGWDATPRATMHGGFRPRRYPWWPVVTGEHPDLFYRFGKAALRFSCSCSNIPIPLIFVASMNEWSEGHYLEPDKRYGTGWLEAIRQARHTL